MVQLAQLVVADPPEAWTSLGFDVHGCDVDVAGAIHHLDPDAGKRGIVSWTLAGVQLPNGDLDGLVTAVGPSAPGTATAARAPAHPNGVAAIDHVVVTTPDHGRTIAALEAAGLELRRTRRTDIYGSPAMQAFFKLGPVILEVVGSLEPRGDGAARFFGIAYTVDDLDDTAAFLGERLHPAKEAVQPGRRIATLDRHAGSGLAMAFMSPDPERASPPGGA
jgi:hypothetical protein